MADRGALAPDPLDRQRLLQAQLCTNMRLRRAARALPPREQAQQSVTSALGEAHVRELDAYLDVLEGVPESLSSR